MSNGDVIETRVSTADLQLGMHVVRLDRSWLDTDFPVQGFIVQSQDDIDALQEQCDYVYIEGRLEFTAEPEIKGAEPASRKKKAPVVKPRIQYINKIAFEEELGTASQGLRKARALARDIIASVRMGRVLDVNRCREVVSETVDSVLRNHQALLWLTQIKHKDGYTAEHSINVCVLAATFARHLGMIRGEIERVALCGLLHDVGKIRVPIEVLNKEGAYTPEELEQMKLHPTHGRDILMSVSGLDAIAVDVAYSHHERISGDGYPRGLGDAQIPYYAKIISVVDAYDAITSNRCYDKARSSKEALDIIYRCRGSQFDDQLALEFIQCIGIYPPGSIVEMSNGEVGIVLRTHPTKRLRPRIMLVRDEDKQPCRERVVDLLKLDLDAEGNPYGIAHELPNHTYGIDLETYLEKGLVLSFSADTDTIEGP